MVVVVETPKDCMAFIVIWHSLLYVQFKVQATNSFCMPLLSYGFGVIDWSKSEITNFDRLVRRVMTAANCHHPCSAIEQLFLSSKLGGRGLSCVENLLDHRLIILPHHLQTSGDALVKLYRALDTQLPSRVSVLSRASCLASSLMLDDVSSYSRGRLKYVICAAQQNKLLDGLCVKPLHGKFINWMQSASVDMDRSFQWL